MTGAAGTMGGIADSNLNVLHALDDLAALHGKRLIVLSLHETADDRPSFLSAEAEFFGFGGKRGKFARALLRQVPHNGLFVFDHVRLALPLAPLLAFGLGKIVILAHGSESWRRLRPTSRWLFRKADLCLANSRFTLRKMHETIRDFNGVDCLLGLSPRHRLNEDISASPDREIELQAVDGSVRALGKHMLLLVGRMDPDEREKGHYELVDVWPRVTRECPDAQLVFAGPGDDRENIALHAGQRGVVGSVFVPGYLPVDALGSLYEHCYGFVMPSRQEGFGLVYLEAMNHAKPCVGCFNNGGEDVIVDGNTGFLIRDPSNQNELFNVIRRLFQDEAVASQMGQRGWKRLQEHFTAAHAQERLKQRLATVM